MGAEAGHELIQRGWQALAEADWDGARACFEQAQELSESAEALDGLGRALHFQGEYSRAIELTERAFAAYREDGKRSTLPTAHAGSRSCMARSTATWRSRWLDGACRIAARGREECAGHGWLMLDRAPFTDDADERQRLATAALAIARRFGDVDLEYDALALLGESYVAAGRVREGMNSSTRRWPQSRLARSSASSRSATSAAGC